LNNIVQQEKQPSDLMRHTFDEHLSHYGDPDMQFRFEAGESKLFNRLDVFVWQPTGQIPMTTFTTAGMADMPMKGVTHRCEIHWTLRGKLTEAEESACAQFLATLAEYPFIKNISLDHWHIIANVVIPVFPNCSNILFHPTFVKDGWDTTEWNGKIIKILNLVPITNEENQIAVNSGVPAMLDHLFKSQIDLFSDRK
jgi:hypothetical protein